MWGPALPQVNLARASERRDHPWGRIPSVTTRLFRTQLFAPPMAVGVMEWAGLRGALAVLGADIVLILLTGTATLAVQRRFSRGQPTGTAPG